MVAIKHFMRWEKVLGSRERASTLWYYRLSKKQGKFYFSHRKFPLVYNAFSERIITVVDVM